MAGDWLKIEHTLPDKPEVVRMAGELGVDQDAVSGKLLRLWIWADQNSVNGTNIPITFAFIDRLTVLSGFAAAMRKVGWLEGRDGSLSFPRFDRHNGQTAKARADLNRRVAKSKGKARDSEVTNRKQEGNKNMLPKPLPEKRREEIENKEIGARTPDAFEIQRFGEHIIRRWNQLPGVQIYGRTRLSGSMERELERRSLEDDWPWEAAMLKFPLASSTGWKPRLLWFLQDTSAQEIVDGTYERKFNAGRQSATSGAYRPAVNQFAALEEERFSAGSGGP